MFRINQLENRVAQLEDTVNVVRQELSELTKIRILMETLVSKTADMREPARANWTRYSYPDLALSRMETLEMQAVGVKRVSKHLALLEPPPVSRIDHVTICLNGSAQYVFAYDASGRKLPYFSGWFHEVGLRVLEAAGAKEWKEAGPGSEEWNEVFQTVSA